MRVLLAHNRYRSTGGEERHIELLSAGLKEAGVEVMHFERRSSDLKNSALEKARTGLGLAYRPGGGGIGGAIAAWRPSVVHFHNIWPLLTPSALKIARDSGARVVLTTHNYRFACPGGTLLRASKVHEDCIEGSSFVCGCRNSRGSIGESLAYGLALEVQRRTRMLERWVDAFVAPSEFMATMMVRSGLPAQRTHVIHHGLPLGENPETGNRSHALYVGRLAPEKGIRTLLKAASSTPAIPLLIAGDGPLRGEVLEACGGNVRWAGRLGPSELMDALQDAAFSVAPAEWYENLPLAVIESLVAGRAVITTRMGGLPEIAGDSTGVFVPPNSPRRLAAAMTDLWEHPTRCDAMGERARRRAEERFELTAQVEKLVRLYERLADRSEP